MSRLGEELKLTNTRNSGPMASPTFRGSCSLVTCPCDDSLGSTGELGNVHRDREGCSHAQSILYRPTTFKNDNAIVFINRISVAAMESNSATRSGAGATRRTSSFSRSLCLPLLRRRLAGQTRRAPAIRCSLESREHLVDRQAVTTRVRGGRWSHHSPNPIQRPSNTSHNTPTPGPDRVCWPVAFACPAGSRAGSSAAT